MSCLAMHMANELLSVPVSGVTLALAAAIVAVSAWRTRRTIAPERLPLMGVMGAFVFAAQMINFTLPGMPGTSGHLGGGVLLAILLGPSAAIVTMTAILMVQCLIFQDGGILALGCNIINMGAVPALLGWGVYRLVAGAGESVRAWRQYLGAWAGCTLGVAGGAALVPLQAAASGVLVIPAGEFLAVMVAVHLLIGLIEGAITFAVLAYLRQVRPALVGAPGPQRVGLAPVLVTLTLTALLLGGVVSWFASTHEDGLEWTYGQYFPQARRVEASVKNDSPAVAAADAWQTRWSLMSDYTRRGAPLGQEASPAQDAPAQALAEEAAAWPNVDGWTSLAGLAGTLLTLVVLFVVSRWIRRRSPMAAEAAR